METQTQKKKRRRLWPVLILLIALGAVCVHGCRLVRQKKILVNRWFVSAGDVTGVDVSRYQADIDMDLLARQGVQFIYIKATEGSSHEDERFAENWEKAGKADLLRGAYHFFSFDSPGADQARHFIDVVGDLSGSLIPVVDVEYYGNKSADPPEKGTVIRELQSFLDTLEEEYGVRPMIYTNVRIRDAFLLDAFDGYHFWCRSVLFPPFFGGWRSWTVWQYSDRGELDGYSGGERYIDLDVLRRGVAMEDLTVPVRAVEP